ncbi:S-layer homology domain-containing protein [Anaerotignum lactatifermentans]|uniref:Repeat domain (List_Bact_rpt) n=1 Tax=Anaerotignum lactatifermentans DSM 14214 TaxID=1121323 RepID=A0A1M6XRJ6_9FIRM|nr:S-layer homology domain-containing protein [Anaerotignum lactatifermentans]SHL08612.1 repeat domain (List_Bact_rpt) [[Clostridium] lactatifermentans DSM 14214] [Anaerotignum lactatifermentans DSM 14214]
MRNKVKQTLSFLLTFVMLCSLLPAMALAKEPEGRYEEVAGVGALVNDAQVHVFTTKGAGNIELTGINKVETTFPQGSGYREYTATTNEGWVFDTWRYEQLQNGEDLGNREDEWFGTRYSFTNSGDNWRDPYTEGNTTISVNRLTTHGEVAGKPIIYNIYADFNPTITATAGENGTISGSDKPVEVEYGTSQAFDIKADTGYIIDTITVDGKDIAEGKNEESYTYTFENVIAPHTIDVTFRVKPDPGQCIVSYVVQGDIPADYQAPEADIVKEGETYTVKSVPEPVVDYEFSGWYDEDQNIVTEFTVTGDVTLTGIWTYTGEKDLWDTVYGTIRVYMDEGTEADFNNLPGLNLNKQVRLYSEKYLTDGYRLCGYEPINDFWYTTNAKGVTARDISEIVLAKDKLVGSSEKISIPMTGNDDYQVTVSEGKDKFGLIPYTYLKIEISKKEPVEETVTLTYDANGGTGAPETATVNKNTEDYVLNIDTTPTREPVDGRDVEFKGWSADEAVINQVYEKDNVPATVTTIDIAEENVTVYAVWAYKEEPPVGTVMLNYDANGGTGAPASATVNKNTEVTLDSTTTPTHAEAAGKYVTFAGWSNDETVKGVIYEKGSEPTTVDKVTVGETDVTVYAVWVYGDPVDPVDPPEPPTWDHSKDKTATELDNNFNSRVTLSLPSAEKELVSDVVFVLDKSSCEEDVTTEALAMLADLGASVKDTGASIKVGAVQFAGRAVVSCELTELTEEAIAEGGAIYSGLKDGKIKSGTNLQAGLLEAQKMLEADKDVEDSRKYVIVITDGLTRQFLAENGTLMTIYNGLDADGGRVWGSPSGWCVANGFVDGEYGIPGGDWDTYYAAVNENVEKDGNTYAHDYDVYGSTPSGENIPDPYVPQGETSLTHALCLDRAIYEADKVYSELEAANYHCYAVFADNSAANTLGKAFVDYLNDGAVLDFDAIQNDIYYLLDAGSQVVDIIGQGKDNKGNDYNFDVVNLENMTITVGGAELNKEMIQSDEFPGSTTYGFFKGEIADGNYDFVVTYYPDGVADADGETREHFVWSINVPVGNFAPAQFSYDVHLTNPQKAKGEYKVETNVEAVLTPKDSNGTAGKPETFPVPELTYEVKGGGSTTEHLMTVIVEGKGNVVVKDVQTVGANDTEVVEIPFGVEKQKFEMEAADGWKLDKVEVTINGKTENLGDVDKYEMDESLIDGAVLKAVFVKDNDGGSGGGSHRPNNKPDETPEALNGDDHFDYVVGYSDGLVHPERNITRAEVASIFFRLLQDDVREKNLTDQNPFNDVFTDDWFNVAVSTMYDMDIVYGRDNNNFDPNAYITRAEFAAIAARFDSEGYSGENLFTDIEGHWAANQINRAAEKGWISGYPDGTFGPDRYITRAEAVTMINRVLNRLPESADALHEDMNVFPDNMDTTAWYYLAIQEATSSHEYEKDKDGVYETWTDVLPDRDWAQYLKLN